MINRRDFLKSVGVAGATAALAITDHVTLLGSATWRSGEKVNCGNDGFLVSAEMDTQITKQIAEIDPIRSVSRVRGRTW